MESRDVVPGTTAYIDEEDSIRVRRIRTGDQRVVDGVEAGIEPSRLALLESIHGMMELLGASGARVEELEEGLVGVVGLLEEAFYLDWLGEA